MKVMARVVGSAYGKVPGAATEVMTAMKAKVKPQMLNERGYPTEEFLARFPNTLEGAMNKKKAMERARIEREKRKKAEADRKPAPVDRGFGFFPPKDPQAAKELKEKKARQKDFAIRCAKAEKRNRQMQEMLRDTGLIPGLGIKTLEKELAAEERFLNAPLESWQVFLSGNKKAWRKDQDARGIEPMPEA